VIKIKRAYIPTFFFVFERRHWLKKMEGESSKKAKIDLEVDQEKEEPQEVLNSKTRQLAFEFIRETVRHVFGSKKANRNKLLTCFTSMKNIGKYVERYHSDKVRLPYDSFVKRQWDCLGVRIDWDDVDMILNAMLSLSNDPQDQDFKVLYDREKRLSIVQRTLPPQMATSFYSYASWFSSQWEK
jgi:hypothetical protein